MWVLRLFGVILGAVLIGMVVVAIRRRLALARMAFWEGSGVAKGLTPAEAALLLGLAPEVVLFLHCGEELGATPGTDREPGPDALLSILEKLFSDLDAKMRGHSGFETASAYEETVAALWREVAGAAEPPEEAVPWLLLAEPNRVWDRMGEGPAWDALRREFRTREQMVARLFSERELVERWKDASGGYLAYLRKGTDFRRGETATGGWILD